MSFLSKKYYYFIIFATNLLIMTKKQRADFVRKECRLRHPENRWKKEETKIKKQKSIISAFFIFKIFY